jgi:hypothetical protein
MKVRAIPWSGMYVKVQSHIIYPRSLRMAKKAGAWMLNGELRSYLQKKFGSRVSFDRVERKLYSHAIGVFPLLFSSAPYAL